MLNILLPAGTVFTDIAFGKPIYSSLLNVDTDKVVSIMKKEYGFSEAGYDNDFIDNITSTSSKKNVLENEKLKFLKDLLLEEFYRFSFDVMKYSNEFRITTSWFTKSEKGESSHFHNHNNCMYSGVFYLQAEENSGDIEFTTYDDSRWVLEKTELNDFNSVVWNWKPKSNLLLIFPSEIYHRISKNNADSTRYSLAFNLVPTGIIGSESSDSHYVT